MALFLFFFIFGLSSLLLGLSSLLLGLSSLLLGLSSLLLGLSLFSITLISTREFELLFFLNIFLFISSI